LFLNAISKKFIPVTLFDIGLYVKQKSVVSIIADSSASHHMNI